MKWIGQQIYDQVSRFRNDTYFEKDVYFQGDTVTFTSANADDPAVIIENTTADAQAARLQFKKHRGVDAVDGDNVGEIEFWGFDDGTPSEQLYGHILTEIHDATSGEESGAMYLSVANHDGGTNTGLKLTGGSTNNEVDVEIGRGGGSVTDVQGTLSMGGTAAMTNAGLLSVANQSNITGLGTITSGVWNGTAINQTYLTGQSGTNTGDETLSSINALDITEVGTIDSGVWNGTAIASAYLDADTAHLSGIQTFTGRKVFGAQVTIDGDHNTGGDGDGAALHIDAHDITDTSTSASGTAAMFTHVNIEAPRLLATNSSVTTTNAASLYIKNAPAVGTNQTITNAYALWVDDGLVKFDGALTVGGTITGDVTGDLTGQAATVATIAGLAPNTATTQATQGNITSCANLATVGTVTTGSWRATQVQIISANFKDNQGTTETFLPLSAQPEEKTGFANEQTLLLMPTGGNVKEIIVRANYNTYTSENIVFKVYTRAANKKINSKTQIGSDITIAAPTQNTTDSNNTRSTGEITHAYVAGDMLGISMTHQSTGPTNANDRTYVTVVLENDLSDLGY